MFKISRKRRPAHDFRSGPSIGQRLTAPFRRLLNRASGGGSADYQLGQQGPLATRLWRLLVQIIWFPVFCVLQIGQFIIFSWTATRSFLAFLPGITPLLVGGGVVGVVVASNYTEDRLARRFHRKFTVDAETSGDFDAAMLGSRRVQMITDEPRWRYIHVSSLRAAGMPDHADQILGELAPLDQAGYIPAHSMQAFGLAREYAEDNSRTELLDEALTHLDFVLKEKPEDRQAAILRGKLLLQQGHEDEAMDLFIDIDASKIDPAIVPPLARYLFDQGKEERAGDHIRRGLELLWRMAEESPDEPAIWDNMFRILMVNENYDKAFAELQRASSVVTDPTVRARLELLKSNVLVEFSRKFDENASPDGFRNRLIVLSKAMGHFPRNAAALDPFIDIVLYPGIPEMESWLVGDFRDLVRPGTYHLVHGLRDAVQGNPKISQRHFNLAFKGDARAAVIINDIARLVALTKDHPEDGLKLVNVAIDTWPEPGLFQTRGEILIELGRHQEALPELEFAAARIENDPRVFEILADCQEALGNPQAAESSRQRAREKAAALNNPLENPVPAGPRARPAGGDKFRQ